MNLDPVTKFLDRFLWVFWGVTLVSLFSGLAQDDYNLKLYSKTIEYDTTIGTSIVVGLLWVSLLIQLVRQIYYPKESNILVKLGLWILLISTSIFTFRATYMLIAYGGIPSTVFAFVAMGLLSVSIILITIGRMQVTYFENNEQYRHTHILKTE